MLFLVFQLGDDRFALDIEQVAEVLPLVAITKLSQAPAGVVGVFNYHGAPVPAIDLSQLTMDRPASSHLNTRIVVVRYPGADGETHLLGLIAEKMTETVRRARTDFVPSGVSSNRAPYLGGVATDVRGLLQRIDVASLLPASVRDVLFTTPAEH